MNDEKVKLIILPFAGGNSKSFNHFISYLGSEVECIVLDYPGHGKRSEEALLTNFKSLLDDVSQRIYSCIGNGRIFLLGYSLGAILAHEFCMSNPEAVNKLVLCSRIPPNSIHHEANRGELSDENLKNEVVKMGGTNHELASSALFKYYLNIIRADFRVVSDYSNNNEMNQGLIKCPLQIHVGLNDSDVPLRDVDIWRSKVESECQINIYSGGHFFMNKNPKNFAQRVQDFIYY